MRYFAQALTARARDSTKALGVPKFVKQETPSKEHILEAVREMPEGA